MSPFTLMIFGLISGTLLTRSQNLYILQQEYLTWDGSQNLCLFNYDTNLASIHGTTDGTEATTTANGNQAWIGFHDINTEGEWTWTDGTDWDYGTTFFEAPWNTDQPDNYNNDEDCVHILATGEWNDLPCTDGKYALCGHPQPIQIVHDPSNYIRIPAENNTIGTVDVLDEIHIEFDIIFSSFPATGCWGSILQIGDDSIGQRFPAIFVFEGQYFHTSYSSAINWNNIIDSDNLGNLTLGVSYHYMLHQTQDSMEITVDGAEVYNDYIDSHAIMFNRKLYLGNEWNVGDSLFDSQLTNLYITTSNSHLPNGFNYNCDGTNRWTVISGTWIFDDSACTITQTDVGFEGAVVWLGTADTSSIDWIDYKIEIKFQIVSGVDAEVGVLLRSQTVSANNDGGQQLSFSASRKRQRIQFYIKNDGTSIVTYKSATITAGIDYILRVEAVGSTFNVYWNNEFFFTAQEDIFSFGSVGLRTWMGHAIYTSVRIMFPSDNYLYLVCPVGSTQIGDLNADISGCGLEACTTRYDKVNIDDCLLHCVANVNCKAFNWSPINGHENHLSETVCTIYDSAVQTGTWSPNGILCRKNTDPPTVAPTALSTTISPTVAPTTSEPTTISPTTALTAAPTTSEPTNSPTKNPIFSKVPSGPPTVSPFMAPSTASPATVEASNVPTTLTSEPTSKEGRSDETTSVENTVAVQHEKGNETSPVFDIMQSNELLIIAFSVLCVCLLSLVCLCFYIFVTKRAIQNSKQRGGGGIDLELATCTVEPVRSTSAMSSSAFGEDGGENESNERKPMSDTNSMNAHITPSMVGITPPMAGITAQPLQHGHGYGYGSNVNINENMNNMANAYEGKDADEMGSNIPLPPLDIDGTNANIDAEYEYFESDEENDEDDDAQNLYGSGHAIQSPGGPTIQ